MDKASHAEGCHPKGPGPLSPSSCQISKEEVLGSRTLRISQWWLRDCQPESWRWRTRNPELTALKAGRGSPALLHRR